MCVSSQMSNHVKLAHFESDSCSSTPRNKVTPAVKMDDRTTNTVPITPDGATMPTSNVDGRPGAQTAPAVPHAADSYVADSNAADVQSRASTSDSSDLDQRSVFSDDSDEVPEQAVRFRNEEEEFAQFQQCLREIRSSWGSLNSILGVFARERAASSQPPSYLARAVVSWSWQVAEKVVRLHAYARDGVIPPVSSHPHARMTDRRSYSIRVQTRITFDDMSTQLKEVFETRKRFFSEHGFHGLPDAEESSRRAAFAHIAEQLSTAVGETNGPSSPVRCATVGHFHRSL